jgi:phage terminase small subunit
MPVLANPKHELFAQELAKGRTQVQAYEKAGYKPSDSNSTKLAGRPEVQARVAEITGRGAIRAEITVAAILEELEEARSLAKKIDQPAPMVSASMGKAKLAGFLTERVEHTGKDGGPIQTEELSDTESARRIAFALTKGKRAQDAAH